LDEDRDSLTDCADPDCAASPDCLADEAGEDGSAIDEPDIPDANLDDIPEVERDTATDSGVRFSKVATWKDVAAGVEHTCALRIDGTMACFGRPPTSDPREDVTEGLDGQWEAIGSGQGFSCALAAEPAGESGLIACWGAPTYEATQPPEGTFGSLSLGYSHGCARDGDGALSCWGWAGHSAIEPPSGDIRGFDLGYHFGCAIQSDESLVCWGKDLFNGNVSPPAGAFAAVDVGAMFGCALPAVPGVPTCWGDDGLGQATPPSEELVAISLGSGHGCGIRSDTTLVCWGDDIRGQASPPDGSGWVKLSSGAHHSCAVDRDGWMACWGWNESERSTPPE